MLGCAVGRSASSRPQRWEILSPTPALPVPRVAGLVSISDIRIWRGEFGGGEPVLFLHGGLAHSNYWGRQIADVAARHRVIAMDTRGHGRSTSGTKPLSYRLLADDVLGLLDALKIERTAIVGWSDGAIVGLDMAMRRPDRLSRLFAFGANFNLGGLWPEGPQTATFIQYAERCRVEYAGLSPAPANWPKLVAGLRRMWSSSPSWTTEQLSRIRVATVVAGAEYDEIIRQEHTAALAAAIPGARLVTMPAVSHFAMLQDPERFNAELLAFLRS
ncbi:MAG: alpha/beta hydrolase [Alphaproteobacteria bacterium]|nr:alpha/beta hydrolase [Alphaproteobacteria bacterium]